ncbi:MAG: antibiotic biosynthesis monooxygenase family protein [Planctomycetota bacterium]|jgi:heme-degrading monooxygenase HmoA
MADGLASTPEPPYYAVVFSSKRDPNAGDDGYPQVAARMYELAQQVEGYLGFETARGEDGVGISVSYWRDKDAIRRWRADLEHIEAMRGGRSGWYKGWRVRTCLVEREKSFELDA